MDPPGQRQHQEGLQPLPGELHPGLPDPAVARRFPANCLEELEYRVLQEGFVGVNINLDPTDGYWTDPPLTDE